MKNQSFKSQTSSKIKHQYEKPERMEKRKPHGNRIGLTSRGGATASLSHLAADKPITLASHGGATGSAPDLKNKSPSSSFIHIHRAFILFTVQTLNSTFQFHS
jgi:hypothetical protein